jgi:hypothetical protein
VVVERRERRRRRRMNEGGLTILLLLLPLALDRMSLVKSLSRVDMLVCVRVCMWDLWGLERSGRSAVDGCV